MADDIFSVVIATRNRAPYLRKALGGLAAQEFDRAAYEVVVVDNGSTDETTQVVGEFTGDLIVKTLQYPTPGSSAARNRGLEVARGRYVAFLDDDAIPDTDWLSSLQRAFEESSPGPICVGGAVYPIWEAPQPDWLRGFLLDHLSIISHSPAPKYLTGIIHGQKLASVNMAVVSEEIRAIGGFPGCLGRFGDLLLGGEDVLVQLDLEQRGGAILYDPRVRVAHHVSPERMTPRWLSERSYWGGVTDALLAYAMRPQTIHWALRTLAWGVRDLASCPRLAIAAAQPPTQANIAEHCRGRHKRGFIDGSRRAVRFALRGQPIREGAGL